MRLGETRTVWALSWRSGSRLVAGATVIGLDIWPDGFPEEPDQ